MSTDKTAGRMGGMAVSDDLFEAVFRPPCTTQRLAAAGASPFGFAEKLVELLGLTPRQVMAMPDDATAEDMAAPRCWVVIVDGARRIARVAGINADDLNRAIADLATEGELQAAA